MNVATGLSALVAFLWFIIIGLIVVAVIRASRGFKTRNLGITILILIVSTGLLTLISAGLVFVQPEERGVVISALDPKGYREIPLDAGLHWVFPFLENVRKYPISRQTYTMSIAPAEGQISGDDSIAARTLDGQEVLIDASVIYSLDPAEVVNVHIDWQDRYSADLVRPVTRGVIRDAVARYGIQQVYSTERAAMTQSITDALRDKLEDNGLVLVDFVLRNITFSPEYAASVEQKQVAEQQAQQAKFVVESKRQEAEQARQAAQGQADAVVIRAKGDAESRLIQAEAEAKVLELIAAALRDNPDLITYQYVNRLAPGVQVMLVPNDTPYLLPLPSLEPAVVEPAPLPQPTTTP